VGAADKSDVSFTSDDVILLIHLTGRLKKIKKMYTSLDFENFSVLLCCLTRTQTIIEEIRVEIQR
jgi:hypothetical protein